jgi:hypothetical protein
MYVLCVENEGNDGSNFRAQIKPKRFQSSTLFQLLCGEGEK